MKIRNKKGTGKLAILLILVLTFMMLLFTLGQIEITNVFAYSTTVVYTSAGNYVIENDNILADCRQLTLLGLTTFNIKPSVNSVSFLGSPTRSLIDKEINVEERDTPLYIYFTDMELVGKPDGNGINNNCGDTLHLVFSGTNQIAGGFRTIINTDITDINRFCCAIMGRTVSIEGSGSVRILGGNGLASGCQGGIGFLGANLTISCPNVTIKGGDGFSGKNGSAGTFPGGNGGNGEVGGDGRNAVLLSPAGIFHVTKGGNVTLIGGNGGRGGYGGNGGAGKDGALFVNPIGGGNGGYGGDGGLGFEALVCLTKNCTNEGLINNLTSNNVTLIDAAKGSQGISGVGGNGGTGGNGSYSMYGNPKNNHGDGGAGGEGGNTSGGGIAGANGTPGANGLNDPRNGK